MKELFDNPQPRAALFAAVVLALVATSAAAAAQPRFRGAFDAYEAAPAMRGAPLRALPSGLRAAGEDAHRHTPVLLVGSAASTVTSANDVARLGEAHVGRIAAAYGLSADDLRTVHLAFTRRTRGGGDLLVYRQRAFGTPLFETRLSLLLDPAGNLRVAGGQLHPTARDPYRFAHDPASAVSVAMADAWGRGLPSVDLVTPAPIARSGQADLYFLPSAGARARGYALDGPARAKRVLYPMPTRLVPATYVELWFTDPALGPILVAYVVSAEDHAILARELRTAFDSFSYTVFADTSAPFLPVDSLFGDVTPDAAGMPTRTLPPFASQGAVVMEGFNTNPEGVADPWLPDGATQTRGNNVDAYADLVAPDDFNAGDRRAAVTSRGVFDHAFDPMQEPNANVTQISAVVTHLFYQNNWLHDYFYDLGFDEAAGNAQDDNFGRGGEGGDRLRAEAMDHSGRNNASMSTPADGSSPRMHMYLWRGRANAGVDADGSTYAVGIARWGPAVFDVTAPSVLVDDGSGTTTDACQPIAGDLSGTVALIDRGDCSFWIKVFHAQSAGAVGAVVMNNRSGGTTTMGGTPEETISIPSLFVSQGDGAALRGAALGTDVRIYRAERSPQPDSSLDATVVFHEWGHYIHNRLSSGRSRQRRSQGEGWGDVLALFMLARADDDFAGAHPHAGFSNHGREFIYFGTRRMPFSTSRAFNALSFRHVSDGEPLPDTHPIDPSSNDNSEVHNAGEVWASMTFDAFASIVERTREASPAYDFEEAKRRFASYMVLGMQLAPRNPTFTEQRDTFIAAALDTDAEDARRIAAAFAGRGAGTCAVSPDRGSTDLVGVVEDFSVGAAGAAEAPVLEVGGPGRRCDGDRLLDAGEDGLLHVAVHNTGLVPLTDATVTIESGDLDVVFPDGATVDVSPLGPGGSETVTIPVTIPLGAAIDDFVRFTAVLESPSFCEPARSDDARFAMDRDAEQSFVETFDIHPEWLVESSLDGATTGVWSVTAPTLGGTSYVLRAIDSASRTDTAVELPSVVASRTESLVLSFSHRFSFEASDTTLWDGGVIEVTFDGTTWNDVADYVDPGYTGPLSDRSRSPLALRDAYSRDNPSFPDADTVTLDFGTDFGGRALRFRFRVGTDQNTGGGGWEIDDVSLTGATPAPFIAFVADTGDCADAPIADAGPDIGVYPGETFLLDGSGSTDPAGGELAYAWSVLPSAPPFPWDGADTETAEVVAPWVEATTDFIFRLEVDNGVANAGDDVRVRVYAGFAPPEGGDLPPPDATAPDGGMSDGEADAAPDTRRLGGGGCSCRATSPARDAPGAGLLLVIVAALSFTRRRR